MQIYDIFEKNKGVLYFFLHNHGFLPDYFLTLQTKQKKVYRNGNNR